MRAWELTPGGRDLMGDFPETRMALTEADMQAGIVEAAQLAGWLCYHTRDSRGSAAGFPDLVLVRPPEMLFLELKGPGGRVSDEQAEWIEALQGCDQLHAAVLWPAGYDALLSHLARPLRRTERLSRELAEVADGQ